MFTLLIFLIVNEITDDGLAYLKDVQTIDLSYCNQITDSGLIHLKGVDSLNLSIVIK